MASQPQVYTGASHIQPQLSLFEKVHALVIVVAIVLPKFLIGLSLDLLRKRDFSKRTIRRQIRKNVDQNEIYLPLRTRQSRLNPTGVNVAAACASENLPHESVKLDAGNFPPATLHFIDCSSSTPTTTENIYLYFHGGGYVFPLSAAGVKLAHLFARTAHSKLVVLEYTLGPYTHYPAQLAQASAALSYLLHRRQVPASQILIAGESGGGNLVLALLSHLKSPHPKIQPATDQQIKLRGACCLSPRCSNTTSSLSYALNGPKDVVGVRSMNTYVSALQPAIEEIWASPIKGSAEFWRRDVPAERVLLAAGEDEVYRDDIVQFAELMGAETSVNGKTRALGDDGRGKGSGSGRVQLRLYEGEIHCQHSRDWGLGITDGGMFTGILEWLGELP